VVSRSTGFVRGSGGLRVLDRYLGIPLVFSIGSLKRKRRTVPDFSTIGIMETAAIGDTVLLGGVITDVRRAFPDRKIILFVGNGNYEVACLLQGLDEIVKLPLDNPLEAVRIMRARRLDVMCDFGPWPRINALYTLFSGARFTIGYRTARQYRHYAYDRVVDHSAAVHELENQRNLVRVLGVDPTSAPMITANAPLVDGLHPNNYIVFHAWPGGYRSNLREWPDSHWLTLAEQVVPLGFDIVLTGAAGDAERAEELKSRISACCGANVASVAGRLDMAQTAVILRNAAAVVSVNTGTMHLAAAVGAAVVGLNGPTSAKRWRPVGERAVSADAEGPGCGYLNLGFEYDGQREDCMALIKPERVWGLLKEMLDRTGVYGQRNRALSMPRGCVRRGQTV
jgi:heptosyltransferase I